MRQQDYETITSCIQYGAPALAPSLLAAFNKTIENSNSWVQEQKRIADEEAKKKTAEQLVEEPKPKATEKK